MTRGEAASHPREQIAFRPPAVALLPLDEAVQAESSQSVLFLDSSQCSDSSLLFLYSRGFIRKQLLDVTMG
jgi:hypothetical protein